MPEREEVAGVLSSLIDQGYRYLESKGWYRYNDGIAPPDPYRHGLDATEVQRQFRKAIDGLESLRFELTNHVPDIPF